MKCESIKTHVKSNGVAYLTLHRPEKKNALNLDMLNSLSSQLDVLAADTTIKVLMINAVGDTFCAGADIQWMKDSANLNYQENVSDALVLGSLMQKLYQFPKPTICLVQGYCFGGAIGLVASSDIAICSLEAKFCFSEVKIGLIPAVIAPFVLQAIGIRQAKRYMLSAEILDAQTAQNMGLIHELTNRHDLTKRGEQIIETICNNAPLAQITCKQFLQYVNTQPISETLTSYTAECIAKTRTTKEGIEGLSAFLEKRKPDWIA